MTIADFLGLFSTSITVNTFSTRSTDGWGTPSYATATSTYQARVVTRPTEVQDANGQTVISRHTLWVASTSRIGARDKLTWAGSTYDVVSIIAPTDANGVHHVKVFVR